MRKPIACYMRAGTPHVVMDDGSVWYDSGERVGTSFWCESEPLPGTVREHEVRNAKAKQAPAKS